MYFRIISPQKALAFAVSFFVLSLLISCGSENDKDVLAVKALTERLLGDRASDFRFELLENPGGEDVFEISSADGNWDSPRTLHTFANHTLQTNYRQQLHFTANL